MVVGDLDLIRPLRRAGARIIAVTERGAPAQFSRDVWRSVPIPEQYADQSLLGCLEHARKGFARCALFFQQDRELLTISRHRDRLREQFGFVLAEHELILDMLDKGRFQQVAQRLGLPVPPAVIVDSTDARSHRLHGSALVKPLNRTEDWPRAGIEGKAVQVDSDAELQELAERVSPWFPQLLVQHLVRGPEDRIESYHAYVDASGTIAGEFAGCKVRTYPTKFGHTTALRTTDQADVLELGREVLDRLGLRGVAKVDFKRGDDGRLWLLEVNPRFNLWHNVGAAAGVNLPAMVLADVTGVPRPPSTAAVPGVTWCSPLRDFHAARAERIAAVTWLRSAYRSNTYATLSLRDPAPFLRGGARHLLTRRHPQGRADD